VDADAVMREGQMHDVGGRGRHVAVDTAVPRAFLRAPRRAHGATLGRVTGLANGVVMLLALGRGRLVVRVVAGSAGKRLCGLVAAAEMHLLDMADNRHGPIAPAELVAQKEILQGQTGPKIAQFAPSGGDGGGGTQVALLADCLQRWNPGCRWSSKPGERPQSLREANHVTGDSTRKSSTSTR
jgi:hypothetical protein